MKADFLFAGGTLRRATLIFILLGVCLSCAVSGQPVANALAEVETPALIPATAETVSVDFPDEDVRVILRSVADLYDLNVVIPGTLQGRTSIRLNNVTWRQLFDVLLESHQFTYEEDGNIIKVRSLADAQYEAMTTRLFLVDYANAADLAVALTALISSDDGAGIQVDKRSNALIVTERPTRLKVVEEMIVKLDQPTAQVSIESKFIETRVGVSGDFGLDWQVDGVTVGQMALDAQYGWGTGGAFPTPSRGAQFSVLSPARFDIVLRALENQDDLRLVSNPTVTTLNNHTASIHIGDEYPIPEYTYNAETGTFEVSGFEFKPIGINLDVTPQVNTAGLIHLRVVPEISNQNGFVTFGGAANTQIPIIATRKTDTLVALQDGYTLAIGGLLESRDDHTSSGIPLLMDIPLLGGFFRVDSKQDFRRNLIIFVTAKTLSPDGSDFSETVSPQQLYEMNLTERDLPGAELTAEEKARYEQIEQLRRRERLRLQEEEIARRLQQLERQRAESSTQPPRPVSRAR